jgi:universal stress protein A
MSTYKHLLVGLDLSPESQQVVDRVKFLFSDTDIKISVCHILEPLAFTYGGDIPVDLSDVQIQLEQQAKERLDALADQLNVAEENRHGLALIFGSTSNSVLHAASCDVLAVRINEN